MMSRRDMEKYTKGFILKSMQVIVESRLGEKISRKCCPSRNDWFNIAIQDNKKVEEGCLRCLDSLKWISSEPEEKVSSGFTIDARWKVCCEISLKSSDDQTMSLEYWLFENCPNNDEAQTATNNTNSNTNTNTSNGSPLLNNYAYNFANIHNKMGLLIKSLMSLSRATPAFKLSARGQSEHSHVICYRICQCDVKFDSFLRQVNPDSGEIDKHFTSEIWLGSVRSGHNRVNVTFCYRTDLTRCNPLKDNGAFENSQIPYKDDHFGSERRRNGGYGTPDSGADKDIDGLNINARQPLAAFESSSPDTIPFPLLPEAPLLDFDEEINSENDKNIKDKASSSPSCGNNKAKNVSKPICIPSDRKNKLLNNVSPSPIGSSLDSFVFVENRPPFAPDEDNDVGSFFNGPSPSFTNSGDIFEEITDISNQLAAIESNAHQWDSFVDSVCSPDSEEDEELKMF